MMKKVCILFMVFMMAISINLTAIAEDEPAPDFSTVGLEELMKVYEAAQQELLSRLNTGDTDSSIARGQYIVGKDINPGMILRDALKLLIVVLMLFPIVWTLLCSFKTDTEIFRFPPNFFPDALFMGNYRMVMCLR